MEIARHCNTLSERADYHMNAETDIKFDLENFLNPAGSWPQKCRLSSTIATL